MVEVVVRSKIGPAISLFSKQRVRREREGGKVKISLEAVRI